MSITKPSISCVRRFKIDAGHRVFQHESKCANVHGHEYRFEVAARRFPNDDTADRLGRVIDFSVLKTIIGTWLDINWDHGMLLFKDDPIARLWKPKFTNDEIAMLDDHKYYLLPYNPTAENLAKYLLMKANQLLVDAGHDNIEVFRVTCHETMNCFATASI